MHAQSSAVRSDATRIASVIHEETAWRRRPGADAAEPEQGTATVSRWIDPATHTRIFTGEVELGFHTIGIGLRQTSLRFSAGGRILHAGPAPAGALQISSPGQAVSAEFSAACDDLRLYVPNGLLAKCFEAVHGRRPTEEIVLIDPSFSRDPAISQLVPGMLAAEEMGGAHGRLCAEGISLAVVARLLAGHSNFADMSPRPKTMQLAKWRLARAKDYIEVHLDQSVHLADIAAAAGLSRMHFAAQFRAATGLRPHEYVLRRRIERAQVLLSRPKASLVDVALSVGFQTQAHFTTVFRNFVGQTPLRWRQLNAGFPGAASISEGRRAMGAEARI